jgi:hypothetical protein
MIDDIVQNAARRVVVDLYLFVQTVDQFAAKSPINRGSMMLPFEPCPKFLDLSPHRFPDWEITM